MTDTFSFELFSDVQIDENINKLPLNPLIDTEYARRATRFDILDVPVFTEDTAMALLVNKVPHIAELIKIAKSPQLKHRVIGRLIMDSRDGKRNGFSKDIYTALLFLHSCNS